MAHLAGFFAGIVQIDVPTEHSSLLVADLQKLEEQGLRVITEVDAAAAADRTGALWALQVVGNDRPGIVREVCQVLTLHEVNVEELSTECAAAPLAGGRLFRAEATLRLPDGLSPELLQDELENLAADLMIDLHPEQQADQ